ncbi:MAG: ribosomal protein S18-alanine N-acetyltransferase [Gemmatimonadetes bacterium]|nr:ribosomal protein S18-alanine N-acetyltransferase [Gemmatimonadota bacterium]
MATAADLPAMVAIERAVFSDPWTASAFQALMGPSSLVAIMDGEIAGYVFARVLADEGEILNLAVRAERRGQGVGRRLLDCSVDQLRKDGARTVYLEVRASNDTGQAFYRRMGFEEIGRRRGYYDKPHEDALVFARRIAISERPA